MTIGDFADVPVKESYPLIFAVFNTFFVLTSQAAQVRCFARVAQRLSNKGVFVIEAFVPDPARYSGGQNVSVPRVDDGVVHLNASRHDPVSQRISTQHVVLEEGEVHLYPIELRYAWPSELDLMARLAGLRLRERWGGWNREPFTAVTRNHLSIYERDPSSLE